MGRFAIAAAALMLVAACGSVRSTGTPEGVIPWAPLPAVYNEVAQPTPRPYPVPAGTPACTASQVHAVGLDGEGATGRFSVGVGFAGATPEACFLDGTPLVKAFGPDGQPIDIKQQTTFGGLASVGPALTEPVPLPYTHQTLQYGQAALVLDWDTQPEMCAGSTGVEIGSVAITLPGGGTLTTAIPTEPLAYACGGLGVGSFQAALQPVDTVPVPPTPDAPAITLRTPSGTAAGATFKYVVTLTNDSKVPINLTATCPNYEEELFADIAHGSPPLGGKHFFGLNCQPAGTLRPGEQADFEMVFPVPPDATPGTYTLMFAIGYTNAMTRTAEQPLTITA